MTHPKFRAFGPLVLAGFVLSGCSGTTIDLGSMFGGSRPTAEAAPTAPRPKANEKGVIKYPNYAVIEARSGDTLETMGARVAVSAEELSKLNGLPLTYKPRPGELMVLPKDANLGSGEQWSAGLVKDAIDRAPSAEKNPSVTKSGDPIRHKVEPGETAFSIARLYDVSVTSLASWNGLNANLTVEPGRTLIIPVALPREERTASIAEPGTASTVKAPPSAVAPLPKNVETANVPESPNLAKDRTPIGVQRKLAWPVKGKIIRGFSTARGASKNEGIDFETAAGAVVTAAEAGEVALVSPSLDRDGKLLLIRHADELITVYTDIDQVPLKKGDKVRRGQKVGVVANKDKPRMHFEVRRGVEPVDPQIYLKNN